MHGAQGELMAALRGYVLRRRLVAATRGLLEGVAGTALLLSALIAVGAWAYLASWGDRGLLCVVVALGLGAAAPAIVRLAVPLPPLGAALALEHTFPYLQDRLATAVDLAQRRERGVSYSERIAERLTGEAVGALRHLPLGRALPTRSVRIPALAAACGMVLVGLTWGFSQQTAAGARGGASPIRLIGRQPAVSQEPGAPRLFDLTLTIAPPKYSRLPIRHLTEDLGTVRALRGSRITIKVRASPETARPNLALEPGGPRSMTAEEDGVAAASFILSRRVTWYLLASDGGREVQTSKRVLIPIPDQPPQVRLVRPSADLTLDAAGSIEVAATAQDDFGVSALGLRYRLRDAERWHSLDLAAGPGRTVSAAARLNLASIGLAPGKDLLLRAYATDNDAVTGPKTSLSAVVTVRVRGEGAQPDAEAPLAQAQQQEADALSRLREEARELENALSEAVEGLSAGDLGEADLRSLSAELQEAAQRLREQAGQLEAAMRQAEQQLRMDEMVTPEMAEKVRELHRLMAQALNEEMRQALEELQKALKDLDLGRLRLSLEQAREAQRRFVDRLDQTLALLRRARLEAELAQLRKLAEALADRQQKLGEQTRSLDEGKSPEARKSEKAQRRLARDTEPLTHAVARVAEHAQEISAQLAASLEALADELMRRDAPAQMRQAASALKRGSPSSAQAPQQAALETLRLAASRLAEAEAALTGELRAELTRAAAEMVRDALHLSQRQEELMADVDRLSESGARDLLRDKERISPLRRQQEMLASAVRRLADRLDALARRTPLVDPSFGREMRSIAGGMSQASRELDGAALANTWQHQRAALAGLNAAAQRLLELGDRMSQASAQMALSEYLKRLQALAQRQRGLNEQSQQAAGEDQRPGSDGRPSLAQLALEQAMIRAALQKLMQGAGSSGQQITDQLGGTPTEMEKVEDDLKAGRLRQDTLERQADILQRMLDAQRSLYTKSPERSERKAERPEAYELAPSPPPLAPSLLEAPPVADAPTSSQDSLPVGFEDLVREYFRRLGREGVPR